MRTTLYERARWWTLTMTSALALGAGCGDDAGSNGDAGTDGSMAADGSQAEGGGGDGGNTAGSEYALEVSVENGDLEGVWDGESRSFLGIPYAKPPVGELRWAAPEPAEPWDGVREAKEFGARCAQNESSRLMNAASDDEDCLYLNVWTPKESGGEPYPVMFWIHGGGNRNGSASEPVPYSDGDTLFYTGKDLAEAHDVVVVTLNYRLGVFGFMAHPALGSDTQTAGNQGLRDQKLALEWVRDNIEAFGGDPERVTIFGESAGSFDVCLHVASPQTRGLFHRAISQSGGCTTKMTTAAEAEAVAETLATEQCDGADDVLACLRDLPVADLLAASGDFGPHVDGQFVPDQPRSLFDAGDIAEVPYMLGSTADEGSLFLLLQPVEDETQYMERLVDAFGEEAAPAVAEQYPIADFEGAMPNPEKAAVVRAIGDARLVCTTYDTSVRAEEQGLPVYTFNFAIPAPIEVPGDYLGATHGSELAYVFGSSDRFDADTQEAMDATEVSNLMQRYWTRFGASGDPNGGDDPNWPQFSLDDNQRMNFSLEPEVVTDFRADECAFWRSMYEQQFE